MQTANTMNTTSHPAPKPAAPSLRPGSSCWLGWRSCMPSFVDLFRGIWSTDEQAHGPIVLGLSLWLLWRKWPDVAAVDNQPGMSVAAWAVLAIGALAYALGRSQQIYFEIGSVV